VVVAGHQVVLRCHLRRVSQPLGIPRRHYVAFHAWLKEKYAQYGKNETYFA